jgi:hypothetical protein
MLHIESKTPIPFRVGKVANLGFVGAVKSHAISKDGNGLK